MTVPNMPTVKVEVSFSVDAVGGDYFVLDDPDRGELDSLPGLAPDNVWVDVTDQIDLRAAPVQIRRGRSRETESFQPGMCSFTLRNDDGRFDPLNEDSPYWPDVTPRRRLRVTSDGIPLFAGFVEDWPVTYQPPHYSTVDVTAFDALSMLSQIDIDQRTTPENDGDLTGERIRRVLAMDEVAFPHTYLIDDGLTVVSGSEYGESAAAHLQLMERSESGFLFVAADGTLRFRNRHAELDSSAVAVLTDRTGGGIRYSDASLAPSADLLYNRAVVTADGEADVTAENAASRDRYLTRTLTRQVATSSVDERQSQADYMVQRYGVPEARISSAALWLRGIPASQQPTVLGMDLTDVVEVVRQPPGSTSPATYERVVLVDGVEHTVSADAWSTSLRFSSVDTRSFLRLDDEVFGVLDENRLAY